MQTQNSLQRIQPLVITLALMLTTVSEISQTPPAKVTVKHTDCPVHSTPVSPADIASANLDLPSAEQLYDKERRLTGPAGERAHVAWIVTLLDENKSQDAEQAVQEWSEKAPANSWGKVALSQVKRRKGDILNASATIKTAFTTDPCNSWVRAELAHVLAIGGMSASSAMMMDEAHTLAPDDLQIKLQWLTFPSVRVSDLTQFLAQSEFLTSNNRVILTNLRDRSSRDIAPCRLSTPFQSTPIPYKAIQNGPKAPIYWGLSVSLDGKLVRLKIDTGKSGLTLSRGIAESLHLTTQTYSELTSAGQSTNVVVANVKSIKTGALEFSDCAVKIVDGLLAGTADGIIGADVFCDFLLTLDYPGHTVKIDPLPPIPNEPQTDEALHTDDSSREREPRDRYVDPSMRTWIKAFRQGDQLSIPVSINRGAQYLFRLSTGAQLDWVSSAEPHQLRTVQVGDAGVAVNPNTRMRQLATVDHTGPIDLFFGGFALHEESGMMSFNGRNYPGGDLSGVYGILGQQTLELMTISIDYRDNLVRLEYDPKRIVRCGVGINMPGCF